MIKYYWHFTVSYGGNGRGKEKTYYRLKQYTYDDSDRYSALMNGLYDYEWIREWGGISWAEVKLEMGQLLNTAMHYGGAYPDYIELEYGTPTLYAGGLSLIHSNVIFGKIHPQLDAMLNPID